MTTPLLQCPSCSTAISAENRYCPSCGVEVGAFSQLPTAPPKRGPAATASAAAPQPARHISSDSIPAGGFTPGMILLDRYRIIGLLGRGGMGEVYRADDLKLGQPVALKFLPKVLASDPVRRERFFAEVRITRQLAHPNICRVYDIAEYEGQHFLSMEYIDGEDLASLIKRIGYLSNEKALDIARQLTAGLAAAHQKGVLHRDLKPANIMIDGHGHVRITDFGLAIAAADEETEAAQILGTPAYMAPEQFAGKGATTRSDIYSLGLIFYEIYTGKRAFAGATIAELRQQKEGHTPKALSEIRQGIDPVVERLILRCMERDPRARPASMAQLALALPGGDPLAAALAAGETPSPEMVAASGQKEGLRPIVAVAILVWLIAGAIATMVVHDQLQARQGLSLEQSPEVLAARARDFLKHAGPGDSFGDSAFGFVTNDDYVQYVRSKMGLTHATGPRALLFWRRQSPKALETETFALAPKVQTTDPSMRFPGESLVVFDSDGRLVSFRAVPPEKAPDGSPAPERDWTFLLSDAGLDASTWKPVTPQFNPFFYADNRMAWQGVLPDFPDIPVRVEAATYRGTLISFDIIGPWTQSLGSEGEPEPSLRLRIRGGITVIVVLLLAGGIFYFVRRNLRLGRGDRRGAMRLAVLNAFVYAAFWVLSVHHVAARAELVQFGALVGWTLITSSMIWVVYIALEPFVRRRWPQILVSWTRLLSGEWRDPLVGRDVLAGCGFGVAIVSMFLIRAQWDGTAGVFNIEAAAGVGRFLSSLLGILGEGVFAALAYLCLLSILRALLRRDSLAAATIVLFLFTVNAFGKDNSWIAGLQAAFFGMVLMFMLVRFGLLATMVAFWTEVLLLNQPLTLHASAWYSSAGYASLVLFAVVGIYGFRTALGGRPLFDTLGGDDA
jgi:serine/threonine-protein kinase